MMNKFFGKKWVATIATVAMASSIVSAKEVRIASHVSEFSPLVAQANKFAKQVDMELPGRFNFKVFPSGQLGKEKALISNVKSGSLEMVSVASGVLKLDKKLGIFDLPWLFKDRNHVKRAMRAGLEDDIRAILEKKGVGRYRYLRKWI